MGLGLGIVALKRTAFRAATALNLIDERVDGPSWPFAYAARERRTKELRAFERRLVALAVRR
jgi:hypothetical protein